MARKSKSVMTKELAKEMSPGTIKEIFHIDEEGYACGLSVCGELFVGSVYCLWQAFWTYDSPVNRMFVESLWAEESFAKEVK